MVCGVSGKSAATPRRGFPTRTGSSRGSSATCGPYPQGQTIGVTWMRSQALRQSEMPHFSEKRPRMRRLSLGEASCGVSRGSHELHLHRCKRRIKRYRPARPTTSLLSKRRTFLLASRVTSAPFPSRCLRQRFQAHMVSAAVAFSPADQRQSRDIEDLKSGGVAL